MFTAGKSKDLWGAAKEIQLFTTEDTCRANPIQPSTTLSYANIAGAIRHTHPRKLESKHRREKVRGVNDLFVPGAVDGPAQTQSLWGVGRKLGVFMVRE